MISMEIPKTEQYVSDLLTVSGFHEEGAEHHLWVLLHHLYSAVAMYEHLSKEDKTIVASTQKKLKYFFETKCELKERKRRKTEKEGFPLQPLSNEKENKKEKVEKITHTAKRDFSASLDDRREKFRMECFAYIGQYDNESVSNFFNYWSEENKETKKMRFEEERYWSLVRRLKRWIKNQYTASDAAANIRLRKTKKKEAEEVTAIEQQQTIAAQREKANAEREQAQEESKQGQMLTQDYIAQNPNGFLARCAREREAREKQASAHAEKQF